MSGAAALQHAGGYEWRIEETQLLIPRPRAGENAIRVVYRPEGGRVFRRFLLLVDDSVPLPDELVMRSIAEHAEQSPQCTTPNQEASPL